MRSLGIKTASISLLAILAVFGCSGMGGDEPMGEIGMQLMPVKDIGEIAFYQSGNNERRRVVFVHGTPGSASAWDEYLDDDPEGFDFIAYDRPGFGSSRPAEPVTSLSEQARALGGLLPDGEKSILVGHSLGGPIIAKAAVMFPDKIGGLIIVAGSLDPKLEKIYWLQHVGRVWPVKALLPTSLDHSNQEVFALEEELEVLEDELKQVVMPITLIHGTKDRLVPFANVAFMEEKFVRANLTTIVLEGQNHFLPWNSKSIIDGAVSDLELVLRDE